MKRSVSGTAMASAFLLSGCARETVNLDAEGKALKQLSRDWSAQAATGDLDTILAGWADDAVVMPPGMPPIEGKAAIRSYVEGAMRLPGFTISWEPVMVQVARSGDLAYMIERNIMTLNDSTGNRVTTYGKVVTVWRKDPDGQWRNIVDIWNDTPTR